jgi:phage tail tape-measure protein
MSKEVQIIISAKDLASGVFGNLSGNLDKAEKKADQLGNRLSTIGGRLTGLSIAMATGGFAAVKTAADMEVATVALTTLTGSAEKAGRQMEALKKFAKETPFQFPELTDATRRMMAFGFKVEQTIPMLRILGNAVSALGVGS